MNEQRPISVRRRRQLIWGGSAVLLLLVVIAVILQARAKSRYEGTVQALLKSGAKLEIADLYSLPPANLSNGAGLILNAAQDVDEDDRMTAWRLVNLAMSQAPNGEAIPISQMTNWPWQMPDENWDLNAGAQIEALAEKYQELVEQFLTTATNDVIAFDVQLNEHTPMSPMPQLGWFFKPLTMAQISVLADIRKGNIERAAVRIVKLAHILDRYSAPLMMGQLERFRYAKLLARCTWEVMQTRDLNGPQLKALQLAWQSIELAGGMERALQVERAMERMAWRHYLDDGNELDRRAEYSAPFNGKAGREFVETLFSIGHRSTRDARDPLKATLWRFVTCYDDGAYYLTSGETNLVNFRSMMQAKSERVGRIETDVPPLAYTFSWAARPNITALRRTAADVESIRSLVITAIAVQRYRRIHGVSPNSMDQLIPRFIDEPSIDWYDGKPIKIRKDGDTGPIAWSIGPESELFNPRSDYYRHRWSFSRELAWLKRASKANENQARSELLEKKRADNSEDDNLSPDPATN